MWRLYPDAKVGLATGKPSGVAALDVDMKDGKDGCATLRSLGYDAETMSPSWVRTPSGGLHIFLRTDSRLKNWVGKLGEGLDVRATGGYVVAPGSLKDGKRYEVMGDPLGEPGDLPDWPEDLIPVEEVYKIGDVVRATERQVEWAGRAFIKKIEDFAALRDKG